ncbi:hypothetical protein GCM10022406_32690 [Hymenobacter algoricola]|uniref:Peptidoglycan binding-like domain-containing protein n=1 Tax=Hymenobacter algoricola TaxID=486267 RepID=A0ABP7NJ33_9BACT
MLATVYTRAGRALRVPLQGAGPGRPPGCVRHPEQQFMRWFNRQVAANPGFSQQVKSILLVVGHQECTSCQQALVRFLRRFKLGHRLRLLAADAAAGCGCAHCQTPGSRPPQEEELSGEVGRPGRVVGRGIGLLGRRARTRTLVRPGGPVMGGRRALFAAPAPAACATPAGPRPTLRLGARGELVRHLQCRLNFHRVNLPQPLVEDGDWGSKTQAAVRRFQQGKGLAADAVVGPQTWAQLDGSPPVAPPVTPPAPGTTTSVSQVRFRSGADINAFFLAKTGQDFVDWFRGRVGGRGAWVNRHQSAVTMPATAAVKQRFERFWDGIPLVFNSPQINFAQFAALQSIIINETGGQMQPLAERVGTAGHPGIAYAFDQIPKRKVSYNKKPNNTAYALFNDPDYIRAHGQKALASRLVSTQDGRWAGAAYPVGDFPTSPDPAVTGFVLEADFYKFRGRGYIQTTWRNAYERLIRTLQGYTGSDAIMLGYRRAWQNLAPAAAATKSSNDDWDTLFMQSPEFSLTALRVFFGSKSDSINHAAVGDWTSIRQVARDVMGTQAYMNLFEARVRQLFATLGAAPAPVGPAPGPGSGTVPVPAATTGETARREAIIHHARRMMAPPTIEAKLRDENGFRKGWRQLKAIFELAAPAYIRPGWEEANLKRSVSVSNQAGIPHWCGIFAVWATRAAGLNVGTWQIGTGISRTPGFRQISPAQVKKGDVGYVNQPFQHHFLVREVHPDGTIDTIDGNSAGTSTVSTKSRVPLRSIDLFFSAF